MSTIEVGELLYEYTVKLTRVTDYGIKLDDLMAGRVAPPPEELLSRVVFRRLNQAAA